MPAREPRVDHTGRVKPLRVDIVIDNYNYGRFLAAAVDSALAQTYLDVRVIVVDDGSSDDSRAVLARYDGRIELVLKENGGQASALNAGAARSDGDVVLFLDADDLLKPHAAALVVAAFRDHPDAAKVQYRMDVVDEQGAPTGIVKPAGHFPLPSGDVRLAELTFPFDLVWLPNGASAYRGDALRRILPIPEDTFATCPDWYVVHLTALLGEVVSLDEVGASYRVHGANRYELPSGTLDLQHVRQAVSYSAATKAALERFTGELGLTPPHDRILSVADLANRLVSLKLEPDRHPLAGDRVGRLAFDGLRAARRRFDVGWPLKLSFMGWFVLMALAPRSVAQRLAYLLLAERRERLNRLLRPLYRLRTRSIPGRQLEASGR
jgi:glycosyltransferase involved in cell wall biosynthesis